MPPDPPTAVAVTGPATSVAQSTATHPAALSPTLSPEQRRVVQFRLDGGHLLVQAAPGSGKTETIRARVEHLVRHHGVSPEEMLALTFTRRAAIDLTLRIRPAGVWSGTFHAIAVEILEAWGDSVGIEPPLQIVTGARQREVLLRAIAGAGVASFRDDREQAAFLRELLSRISRRKRQGLPEIDHQTGDDRLDDDLVALVHDRYCELLRETGGLDYDDLIAGAIDVLRTDHDAAASYQRQIRFAFIDEFHDISPEQYELVRLLAPPRSRRVQVMAIADRNQAIYDWRGADAEKMLAAFGREYRPAEVRLTRNFRSTPAIVAAANGVRAGRHTTDASPAPAWDPATMELPVDCLAYADEDTEAVALADLIERAVASGRYTFGDIAVLYRTHARSAVAAAALPQHGIPIARVEPERFLGQPEVQEALRYLELLLALRDDHFVPALNWPRVLVDEVTMVHLRRLAARDGRTLCELAERIDDYQAEVTPLTRAAIRDFFATVAAPLGDLVDEPVTALIDPFLDVLRRRRSPIPREHRPGVRDTLDLLGRRLREAEAALAAAIAASRPIAVRPADGGDSAAAAVILTHVLRHYLGRGLTLLGPNDPAPAGAFVVALGQARPVSDHGIGLTVWETPHVSFSLGTQAWRLGQMLLMRHEQAPDLPLVAFDLETGDRHPLTAEIVEIGALRLGETGEEVFARLVRPSGRAAITKRAAEIHGITWGNVADQPAIAAVLPDLLAFLDGAVLVGHSIEEFDYPILRRVTREHLGHEPNHHLIDTYKMARRVLPNERSYRLEHLVRLFDPGARQDHRAGHDITLTARLFAYLRQCQRQEQELDVLAETLPLVALSIHAAGLAVRHDNELLVQAGARAEAFGQGAALQHAWIDQTGQRAADGLDWLRQQRDTAAADDDAWSTMETNWRTALDIYSRHSSDSSLAGFLRYAALAEPIDLLPAAPEAPEDLRRLGRPERVTMMTVHSAKGLEWPLVFLLGVEEGQFPFYRATSDTQLAEEQRLLYVGMTRARRRLCLIWTTAHNDRQHELSRFLRDLPPSLLTHRRVAPPARRH